MSGESLDVYVGNLHFSPNFVEIFPDDARRGGGPVYDIFNDGKFIGSGALGIGDYAVYWEETGEKIAAIMKKRGVAEFSIINSGASPRTPEDDGWRMVSESSVELLAENIEKHL